MAIQIFHSKMQTTYKGRLWDPVTEACASDSLKIAALHSISLYNDKGFSVNTQTQNIETKLGNAVRLHWKIHF